MGAFVDSASAILSQSERRVEISARNVSNITTPGYKRRVSFEGVIASRGASRAENTDIATGADFAEGKEIGTSNPYDLAVAGKGFFVVRSTDGTLYTRQGQFHVDGAGRVVTTQGFALQAKGGGDVVLKDSTFVVASDGAVLESGEPIAKLAVVDLDSRQAVRYADGSMFSAPTSAVKDIDTPTVRQGFLEASNVSMGEEMVSIMGALRQAETGQRLMSVYDDLMGRMLNTFGQA